MRVAFVLEVEGAHMFALPTLIGRLRGRRVFLVPTERLVEWDRARATPRQFSISDAVVRRHHEARCL
jgi:hypothetical protein